MANMRKTVVPAPRVFSKNVHSTKQRSLDHFHRNFLDTTNIKTQNQYSYKLIKLQNKISVKQ